MDLVNKTFLENATARCRMTILDGRGPTSIGFDELHERAARRASGLTQRGIGPGRRVAVIVRTDWNSLISVLAVLRAGAALLVVPQPSKSRGAWLTETAALMKTATPDLLVSDTSEAADLDVQQSQPEALDGQTSADAIPPAPDDLALIYPTSGTTGRVRAVAHTYASVAAWFEGYKQEPTSEGGEGGALSWWPLASSGGISHGVLRPLASGYSATLMPHGIFQTDPIRWLVEISDRRITYSGGPNYSYGLIGRLIRSGSARAVDLSSWQVAYVSGERVDPGTIRAFVEVASRIGFEPRAVAPYYGSTEGGNITIPERRGLQLDTIAPDLDAAERARPSPGRGVEVPCLGRPRHGLDIRIAVRSGSLTQEDRLVGQVMLRGEGLMQGFLRLEGLDPIPDHGWMPTGDLGYLLDGKLYLVGRIKNVAIVRGKTIPTEEIEATVRASHPNIGGCVAFSTPAGETEELRVIVESGGGISDAALIRAIKEELWARSRLTAYIEVRATADLPRTRTGKIRRQEVIESHHMSPRHSSW